MRLSSALAGFSRDLVQVLERTLNPRHGLINSLIEEPLGEEAFGLWLVHAVVSPPTYYRGNTRTKVTTTERGTGTAFSRQNACWAAVGEALERYAASIYWPDQLIRASAVELGDRAVSLARLIRCGRPEIRLFNAAARRAWARGVTMTSERDVLVPAAMTYLGYVREADDEIISQNDSTGLACGLSAEAARMAALCEVIERDVFASNWLLMRHAPRLEIGTALDRLDIAVQVALRTGAPEIRLFHLGQVCGVHVVMCVVTSADGTGVVGAAASPYILRAVEKAVCEGLYSWSSGRKLSGKSIAAVEDIKRPTDHLTYYLEPGRFRAVTDLCEGGGSVSLLDLLVAERRNVTSGDIAVLLKNDGFDAVAVDLTTPDVASLGMSVVRVVVPGLQPLIFGPACVHAPDARRLNQWRRLWGLQGQALNPLPHPFP